jgi:hypothetical protein
MATSEEKGGLKIWKDAGGKLWTLADSEIDTEIFALIGEPVYDEITQLWHQQIQLRTEA